MTVGRIPNIEGGIQPTLLTTTGDIMYASSANNPARLGIGSSAQVLTVASGVPSWATPSSGGMTLISETVASAISSLSLSSIPGTYKQLLLLWSGIGHSVTSNYFAIRLNNNSGSVYQNNRITFDASYASPNTQSITAISDNNNSFPFGINQTSSDLQSKSQGSLLIDNYSSATKLKQFICNWQFVRTSQQVQTNLSGIFDSTTAITSIDIVQLGGSGTFSNATNTSIRLYGIS